MVTQNTTTAAGAAPTGARIRLNTPQANQQVVIDNIAGATLEMGFPSEAAQLEQSGQDLVFLFENGGRIVLSNFFGLFESNQLPAFNLEDGQSLPGDAFLAALREDLLPAAGPGAGAAAGSGGVGDYADDAGDLIGGVDRLDPLGTTGIGTAALPGIEDEGPLDLATGSLVISLTTGVTTEIPDEERHPDAVPAGSYAGAFEDWQPDQHLGFADTFAAVLGFTFTPDDNEVLDTITFVGPIDGTLLVGGVPVLPDGAGNFVISAADLADVTLLPLADSGTDIPLSGFATITDPDSGLSGTVPFAFTAVVDAAADQPTGLNETISYGPFYCDHGDGGNGNGDGEVVTARVMDSEGGDERSFWHHNPHDAPDGPPWRHTAADPTDHANNDDAQNEVRVTLSATFGDYQDGSENHYLIIEKKGANTPDDPSDDWVYDRVEYPSGDPLILADGAGESYEMTGQQLIDFYASSNNSVLGIDPSKVYYVLPAGDNGTPVPDTNLITKSVTVVMHAPDETGSDVLTPAISMTDQGYGGGYCPPSGNDYKATFITGALAIDSEADGSLTTANDTSLVLGSTSVWVASAEADIGIWREGGGYEDNSAYQHLGFPATLGDYGRDIDLDFWFKPADDEVLDKVQLTLDPTLGIILVNGVEPSGAAVIDSNGLRTYIIDKHDIGDVTVKSVADGSTDIEIAAKAYFHDPDSGDVGTKDFTHTVVIDAVADKPSCLSNSADYPGEYTAAAPLGEVTITVSAKFGDVTDGSERHYILLEIKDGWTGYPEGKDYEVDKGWFGKTTYRMVEVDPNDATGVGTYTFTLHAPNFAGEDDVTFKTAAYAVDHDGDGAITSENDTALTTGSVTVHLDDADTDYPHFTVSGSGYEDLHPHTYDNNSENDAEVPLKLNITFNNDDDEILDRVTITATGESFTISVDGVLTHLAPGQSVEVPGSKIDLVNIIPEPNSDRDITLNAKAEFHDPSSGDTATREVNSTITLDAVADKPVITVDVNDGNDGGSAFQTGETGTVHVTASFADTDGSENHWVELKIPKGFSVDEDQIEALGGSWNKSTRIVKWDVESGGTLDKTIDVTQSGASDGPHYFVAKAVAKEGASEGGGNFNNKAENTATDAAVVDSGSRIQWSITDAHDVSNIVQEGDLGENGPPLAFTVGYSGYALEPGETVSIQLTGPAADSTAGLADFTNAADDFAAALQAAVGAVSGISYDAATNTLTFTHGAPTSLTFFAKVFGDTVIESNEDLVITIQNPKFNGFVGGTVADPSEDGTIIDDDKPLIVPPSGEDAILLEVQDADAVGSNPGDVDTDSDNLEFEAGSLPLDFSFDLDGGDPVVSGLKSPLDIDWEVDAGTGNLIGKIGGETAIVLSLTEPADGSYGSGDTVNVGVTVTLVDPLLHASAADIVVSGVKVAANDGSSPAAYGTVSVSVDDAAPTAVDDVASYPKGIITNLVIMIDRSGSMDDPSGIPGMDKWDVALEGMKDLIDAYADLGTVNVKIVDFYGGTANSSSWYYNAESGTVTHLVGKDPTGGTSYDAATDRVMADLATNLPYADKSVVYFLSDGNPDPDSDGLDAGEVAAWESFLDGTPIDAVYSFGIGSSVDTGPLGTVAWNADGSADNIVVVKDLNDFTKELLATVPTSGNLLANDSGGADSGLHLHSVTVDGATYTDPAGPATERTIDLGDNKGSLKIDFADGSYVFTPGSKATGQEVITYEVRDADGTSDTATLRLRLPMLDAHDNHEVTPGTTHVEVSKGDFTTNNNVNPSESHWDGWGHADDLDGNIRISDFDGSDQLRVSVTTDTGGEVISARTFTATEVSAGDTLEFNWEAVVTGRTDDWANHDNDRFVVIIDGEEQTGPNASYTVTAGSKGETGTFTHTFLTDGPHTVQIKVVDGSTGSGSYFDWGWKNNGLRVYIDDVTITHAVAAAIVGNVITDSSTTDAADQLVGLDAHVTEVNGHEVTASGLTLATDYGSLEIHQNGSYTYTPKVGMDGHDDTFVYKLASTEGGGQEDYATLNVHLGSGSIVDSPETHTLQPEDNHFYLSGTGNDEIHGTTGDDVIFGNSGSDHLYGDGGNDLLHGGAGNDFLYGEAGNDILVGGQGSDELAGGIGADTFVWNAEDFTTSAVDRVTDFNMGDGDVLRFSDVLIGGNPDVVAGGALSGTDANDAVVTLHNGAQTQYVVIQNALDTNTLDQIEQHILTNKIITENS